MSSNSTTTTSASASSTSAASLNAGPHLQIVGIILAICSGVLIGTSFVFKKKGLIQSQAGHKAGEGVAYLKSPLWWSGMIMMILGELCNFAAYAFVAALVVTPMGALSVVISAILSSLFLKEKLSFFGWIGCFLCIVGSVTIALNGPQEQSIGQIVEFQALFLSPGFLVYAGLLILASLVIIFYFAPRHGTKSMLWYISVCSMIGGISVSVTTGLGAAIVTTAMGDNQFTHWFIYFLIAFVAVTLITEVYYLNRALALFNTAMVTPTYYVIFTFCTMVTTVVLFQGLKASATQILTVVMGFLTICAGITILQLSKVDPTTLTKLDRRSTILLQAARHNTEHVDEEKISGVEDPGVDTIRGSFGAVGSIIRARTAKRLSQSSRMSGSGAGSRSGFRYDSENPPPLPTSPTIINTVDFGLGPGTHRSAIPDTVKRHQLYDTPMPSFGSRANSYDNSQHLGSDIAMTSPPPGRKSTIKFGSEDLVHQYGDNGVATHEFRPPLSPRKSAFTTPGLPSSHSGGSHSPPTTPRPGNPGSGSGAGAGGGVGWPRAQDLFDDGSAVGSLKDSRWYDEDEETRSRRESAAASGQRDKRRTSKPPNERYPRSAGSMDQEESRSLWKGSSNASASSQDDLLEAGQDSIRLVGKK